MAITTVPANPQVSTNVYGAWTNPEANMALYNATNATAPQNLFNNPYFIQALGGLAEGLDPQGVGGTMGKAATAFSKSRQAAKANETAIADSNKRHQELIAALARHGGMTPKGTPGPTSVSMGPDGSISMKIDSNNPVVPAPPPKAPDRDTTSSQPGGAAVPETLPRMSSAIQARSGYDANAPSPMELIPPSALQRQRLGPVPATNVGPTRSSAYNQLTDIIPFYQAPLRSRPVR